MATKEKYIGKLEGKAALITGGNSGIGKATAQILADTEIIAGSIALGQYDYATVAAMQPMNRMGRPEEIAQGIAWLLSDDASFVTGHVLSIDGGFQAK